MAKPPRRPKAVLATLSPEPITFTELAGENSESIPTRAPSDKSSPGGLKAVTACGSFETYLSGMEDVYKIDAASFRSEARLLRIAEEAQSIVSAALAEAGAPATHQTPATPNSKKTRQSQRGAMKAFPTEASSPRDSRS